jgi:hypothetical protein
MRMPIHITSIGKTTRANRWLHCKDKMPKIWNKYSQKRNIGASVPISTFMCLWANYIFPRWVCLFGWRKYVDWSWEYINRSKTHECGNWGWGRAIPRKGFYKRNCRCSVGGKGQKKFRLLILFQVQLNHIIAPFCERDHVVQPHCE